MRYGAKQSNVERVEERAMENDDEILVFMLEGNRLELTAWGWKWVPVGPFDWLAAPWPAPADIERLRRHGLIEETGAGKALRLTEQGPRGRAAA
jgi:hypothetical protein